MNGEIEELKNRVAELENQLAEMRALVVKEKPGVPARPPFKYDRARRAYYSKACLAGAQISLGTAIAALHHFTGHWQGQHSTEDGYRASNALGWLLDLYW